MRQLAKLWLRIDWIIWFMIAINMYYYYPYFITIYHCVGIQYGALRRCGLEWCTVQNSQADCSGSISSLIYMPKIIS